MFEPITMRDFFARTGIDVRALGEPIQKAERIVSLRDLVKIDSMQAMHREYLHLLLENVTLVGDPSVRPYHGCRVQTARIDPRTVLVGQTFVQRSKYAKFIECFSDMFREFHVSRGLAKLTPFVITGRTEDGGRAVAHYVPPIVERHPEGQVLMDGVHRYYCMMAAGTTIESIIVHDVKVPFPSTAKSWAHVHPVDEKPPKDERFHDLRREFFRDVKAIGIDG